MINRFLGGDGYIINQIMSIDWNKSPLGAMENWSESLKTTIHTCLNSPFPMLICWGPEMIMLYNEKYAEFLDNPTSALGEPIREIWQSIWDDLCPLLENIMSTGNSTLLKDQMYSLVKNNVEEKRYFSMSYSAIWDVEEVGGVLLIANETTEAITQDRLVKLEKERMQRIVNQGSAAICILEGPEMVFEFVNPRYQQLFPDLELLGKPVLKVLPELEGTKIHLLLMDVYRSGKTFEGTELLFPNKKEGDGLEHLYFDVSFQARWNVQNEVEGVIVFAYEVTKFVEARNSAKELASQVERQARLFDVTLASIKDFIFTCDVNGQFTYSNLPLLELLGVSLSEVIGKTFHDLPYLPELADKLHSQIFQVVSTGKALTDESIFTNQEGAIGYYEYIFTPVFDKDGEVVLVAGSTRDISERKKSEEAIKLKNKELTDLNEQLMRVNSDLDNFIYTASHDLKSPISNIEGLIYVLNDHLTSQGLSTPIVEDLVNMIEESVERFNRTIYDLSDITKLQRLNVEEESMIDMEDMVEDIKKDLIFLLKKAKGTIQLDLGELKHIIFSVKNLRSIFYNLISNSLKYRSPERDPIVKFSSGESEDYFIVTVEDNGMGMDLSSGRSIFGMFHRLHTHVEGTGIGLYIVKKIMDNAGGAIEVESEVGAGSVFRLYFRK